jgi:1-aminocyclopropane-1-carboxylate deaminase
MFTVNEAMITTDSVPLLSQNGVMVRVLRTDRLDEVVSGNKWFKLRFYLDEAISTRKKRIVTFGGAYSNHVVATASVCNRLGLQCAGIIRGEEPESYSHTLTDARSLGMKLYFLSRTDYRSGLVPPALLGPENYFIPEGGYGQPGALGAATIPFNKTAFDTVCCAVGTGTMMAGLITASGTSPEICGFSVMKNNFGLEGAVRTLLKDKNPEVKIHHEFHFGGYAKKNNELIRFMNELFAETGIPTDFVYTAKLFYGVDTLIRRGHFKPGSSLLVIHSGGLQGNRSLRKGTLIF